MTVTGEARMLIDGELVEAASGAHVRQRQPRDRGGHRRGRRRRRRATCERAIAARAGARSTRPTGPTDRALRKRVPAPAPRRARRKDARDLRAADRRRGRRADHAHVRGAAWTAASTTCSGTSTCIDRIEWEYDLPVHEFFGMRSAPPGAPGADRRRRRDHAVELPVHAQPLEDRARRSPRATRSCSSPRPTRRGRATCIGKLVAEDTDIPPGVFNVVTSADPATVGRDAHRRPPRRHDLVHRLHRGGQAHHGERRRRR